MKNLIRNLTSIALAPLAILGGGTLLVLLFFQVAAAETGTPLGDAPVDLVGLPAGLLFTSLGGGVLGSLGINFLKRRVLPEAGKQLLPVLVPAVYTIVGGAINLLAGTGYALADVVTAALVAGVTSVYSHNVAKHPAKLLKGNGDRMAGAIVLALVLPLGLGACAQLRTAYHYYRDNIAPHVNVDVPGIIDATVGPKKSGADTEHNEEGDGAASVLEESDTPSGEVDEASPSESPVQPEDDSGSGGAAAAVFKESHVSGEGGERAFADMAAAAPETPAPGIRLAPAALGN